MVILPRTPDEATTSLMAWAALTSRRHRRYEVLATNAPLRLQVRFRRHSSRPNNEVLDCLTGRWWPSARVRHDPCVLPSRDMQRLCHPTWEKKLVTASLRLFQPRGDGCSRRLAQFELHRSLGLPLDHDCTGQYL